MTFFHTYLNVFLLAIVSDHLYIKGELFFWNLWWKVRKITVWQWVWPLWWLMMFCCKEINYIQTLLPEVFYEWELCHIYMCRCTKTLWHECSKTKRNSAILIWVVNFGLSVSNFYIYLLIPPRNVVQKTLALAKDVYYSEKWICLWIAVSDFIDPFVFLTEVIGSLLNKLSIKCVNSIFICRCSQTLSSFHF